MLVYIWIYACFFFFLLYKTKQKQYYNFVFPDESTDDNIGTEGKQ